MVRASRARWLGSLVLLCGACGGRGPTQPALTPPPPAPSAKAAPSPAPAPAPDPVAALIATSERHYASGRRELSEGHLDKARREFDRSVSILLESSGGVRADQRLSAHFDRLVDRISAMELTALATGDGFAEKRARSRPPSMPCWRWSSGRRRRTRHRPGLVAHRRGRPGRHGTRPPDSLERPGAGASWNCSRAGSGSFLDRGAAIAAGSTCR